MRAITLRPLPHSPVPALPGQGRKLPLAVALVLPTGGFLLALLVLPSVPGVPAEWVTLLRIIGLAVTVAMVALAAWLSRRAARRQKARTAAALAWIQTLHVCAAPAARPAQPQTAADAPTDLAGRVLRMQVKSLESALEEQHLLVEDLRRAGESALANARRRDQQRTVLTVQALRELVAEQPGSIAVSRIEAALSRVGADVPFARPTLVEGPSGGPAVALAAPQAAPQAAAAPVVEEPAEQPVVEEPAVQAAPAPAVPTAVLPVPAPPAPVSHHRTRRRLRRTAAA